MKLFFVSCWVHWKKSRWKIGTPLSTRRVWPIWKRPAKFLRFCKVQFFLIALSARALARLRARSRASNPHVIYVYSRNVLAGCTFWVTARKKRRFFTLTADGGNLNRGFLTPLSTRRVWPIWKRPAKFLRFCKFQFFAPSCLREHVDIFSVWGY